MTKIAIYKKFWKAAVVPHPFQSGTIKKTYIIRLLLRCAAVPAHEAYIARTAHPVLCTHFGFKKGIRAVSCPYPTPICIK